MYGIVTVNHPELKADELNRYKSYYCGLCNSLNRKYGNLGRMSLSYDMTFLVILLNGLYEPETEHFSERCIAHPVKEHEVRKNSVTEYVSDMSILMAYYKCLDDWQDDRKISRKFVADRFEKYVRNIQLLYPDKCKGVKDALDKLSEYENQRESNLDKVAGEFGRLMTYLFVMQDDEWKEELTHIAYTLGKFIYISDAYQDLDDDIKKDRYNCLRFHLDNGLDLRLMIESILQNLMSECARSFERLPILENADIIRNIIYSGVWTSFEIANKKKEKS